MDFFEMLSDLINDTADKLAPKYNYPRWVVLVIIYTLLPFLLIAAFLEAARILIRKNR